MVLDVSYAESATLLFFRFLYKKLLSIHTFVFLSLIRVFSSKVFGIFLDMGQIKAVMNLKLITTVVMAMICFSDTVESSRGFRGNRNSKTDHMVEWIQKSRRKIVHTIEVKSQVRRSSTMSANAYKCTLKPSFRCFISPSSFS